MDHNEVSGKNNKEGPNGDLKAKLFYESNKDAADRRRLSNGSGHVLPSKNFIIIVLASSLLPLCQNLLNLFWEKIPKNIWNSIIKINKHGQYVAR